MTNVTKWLVALPFALGIAFVVPAAVAGDWNWFCGDWPATVFVVLTAGMWLVATAFVDLNLPRGKRDRANLLIPLALLLPVPLAVADRVYGPAARMPALVSLLAGLLMVCAIVLGLSARLALGRAYQPRETVKTDSSLVQSGPYSRLRHPLYTAALLWAASWLLLPGSLIAALTALVILAPAIVGRIRREERDLRRVFGDEYDAYCRRTWRLVPYLY